MTTPISILIVDEHKMFCQGIQCMLHQQTDRNFIVASAGSVAEANNHLRFDSFDIILLDSTINGADSIQCYKKIKALNQRQKVIILAREFDEINIHNSLIMGINGYLLKNCDFNELFKAIVTVKRGERYYCNEVTQIIFGETNRQNNNKSKNLSKREIEVLNLIVSGGTNKEIAPKLGISFRTVEHHRKNIREKLNIHTTPGLVQFAMKNRLFA